MKWEKPKPEMIALFSSLLPDDSRLEPRKMFGYPCAFTSGNMFCGMHGNNIVVRLPEVKRTELLKQGWKQFVPMPGRIMKEYLVIPTTILGNKNAACAIIKESLEYAFGLALKKPKILKKLKEF